MRPAGDCGPEPASRPRIRHIACPLSRSGQDRAVRVPLLQAESPLRSRVRCLAAPAPGRSPGGIRLVIRATGARPRPVVCCLRIALSRLSRLPEEGPVRGLAALGLGLIVLWVVAFVVFKVAGFLIHLVLIVGAIMLIMGLIRRARGGVSTGV